MPQLDLSHLDLSARHLSELRALLNRHVPDAEVWAFGSRVAGDAHEGSDLDLMLRNPRQPAQPVAGRADLCEALQTSALPMLVEVHDASLVPADFHAAIEQRYVPIRTPGRHERAAGER